jgi:lipoprotein NlpI
MIKTFLRFGFRMRQRFHFLLTISFLIHIGCSSAQEPPAASTAQEKKTAVRSGVARAKFMAGDFEAAIEVLQSLSTEETTAERDRVGIDFALGEVYFANGQAAESVAAFDRVIKLQPQLKPQLWQRGLALYYADRHADVVDQLESHQNYNTQDVENSVWHMLCKAKLSSVEEARKGMIKITRDRRIAMPEIYEMFAGRGSVDQVRAAADASGDASAIYHASLYIGLFHEMMGEKEKSQSAIESAVEENPFGPTVFMGNVARMHAKARGFYGKNEPEK